VPDGINFPEIRGRAGTLTAGTNRQHSGVQIYYLPAITGQWPCKSRRV